MSPKTPAGITARFTDGSTASADVLIGADGIRSTVRTLIDPSAPGPDHLPLLNFGAVADIRLPAETVTTFFVFGNGAFLVTGCSLTTAPLGSSTSRTRSR